MNAEMEVLAYEASTAAYDLGRAMALGVDVEAAKLADEQAVTALVDAIVDLETENAKLKELVKCLVETGNALEAQAYDAWRKYGMLDFPAAAAWTKLVETLEPPEVNNEFS